MTVFYKIRNKETGLFSKGGTISMSTGDVKWSKEGKTWPTLGRLRTHLSQHLPDKYRPGTDMSDWEVVEYHVTESDAKGVHEVLSGKTIVKLLTR